jgi:cytochrome c oxidase subunit II
VVGVTARLWWWEMHYRDPASGTAFTLANELHLPQGQAVTLGLSSADVIHSFWVPALAGKVDMVPGRVHQLRLQADQAGVFRGQCAEFCGEQHARMALHVRVRPAAEHAAWLAAQAAPAQLPADALARQGLQVYATLRCAACHDLRGLAPGTRIGPDLTHVGSRLHLGAGSVRNGHAGLQRWLADNQHVKPGVRMPSYAQLDAASMAALVEFLAGLR